MSLNVVSNYAANVAQRYLQKSDEEATRSLAKLSSGTRVLSARDDAASLSIGSKLRADIASLKMAAVNIGQGASMLQVADGGMSTVADLLTRAKSLSTQAASGQLTAAERQMIDTEFQSTLSEIDRVSRDTAFNGTKLLAGTTAVEGALATTITNYLVDDGSGIANIDVSGAQAGSMFALSYDETTKELTLHNLTTRDYETVVLPDTTIDADGALSVFRAQFTKLGVSFDVDEDFSTTTARAAINNDEDLRDKGFYLRQADATDTGYVAGDNELKFSDIRFQSLGNFKDLAAGAGVKSAVLQTSNASTLELAFYDAANAGGSAVGTAVIAADIYIVNANGESVSLGATQDSAGNSVDANDNLNVGDEVTVVIHNNVTTSSRKEYFKFSFRLDNVDAVKALSSASALNNVGVFNVDFNSVLGVTGSTNTTSRFSFQVGSGVSAEDKLNIEIKATTTSAMGVSGQHVRNQSAAQGASSRIDAAISDLNKERARIGSNLNRFDYAAQNLSTTIENMESARSNLMDLDVAAEMSYFTSRQILQQAGVSMLAQANQMPQNLLRLFR